MPSCKKLRTLVEAAERAAQAEESRPPSPYNENIDAPPNFRRRRSSEFRRIQATVFENLEPFLLFGRPSKRETCASPPLSPRSHRVPNITPPPPVVPRDVWFGSASAPAGSWRNPIVIEDTEPRNALENEGRTDCEASKGKSRGKPSRRKGIESPESDRSQRTNRPPVGRRPSVVEETFLMSGALPDSESQGSSTLADDEATTPEYSEDDTASRIRGGAKSVQSITESESSAEERERLA